MAKQGITNIIKDDAVAQALRDVAKSEQEVANLKLEKELAEAKQQLLELQAEVQKLSADLATSAHQADQFRQQLFYAKNEAESLTQELETFKFGSGISEMEESLERFKTTAAEGRAEFEAFLTTSRIDVNALDDSGHWFEADQIREWARQVEEGAITANQAISNVKASMSAWMEQNSGSGMFDTEQVQTFIAQLRTVSDGIDSIMAKLQEFEAHGIKAIGGEVSGGGAGSDIASVLTSIEQAASNMTPEVKEAYQVITELVSAINQYANIDQNKMIGTLSTFESISKIGKGSYGKKSVENILHLATTLRTLQEGTNGSLRFDFSGLEALQRVFAKTPENSGSLTTLKHLATYLPQIARVPVDKLKELGQIDLSNFNNLKVGKSALETIANLRDVLTTFAASQQAISKAAGKASTPKLDSFINARRRMELALNGETTPEFKRFSDLLDQVQAGGSGFDQLSIASIDAKHSVDKLNQSLRETASVQKTFQANATVLNDPSRVESLRRSISAQSNADPALQAQAEAQLAQALNLLQAATQGDVNAQKQLNQAMSEFYNLQKAVSADDSATQTFLSQEKAVANLNAEIAQYMRVYQSALARNPELQKQVESLFAQTMSPNAAMNADKLKAAWAQLKNGAQAANTEVETTFQRMSKLFTTHFRTGIIMAALNGLRIALRQLWQDIKDVNEALVQTQVVTGITGTALENYTAKAYEAASRSRDTVTNILESATAYGRLGYDSELSVELAELTSMYAKLGATDVSSATDAITAMMKAFDLQTADEIETALDKLIYVGNNFPISASGLGEGLNNAASALSAAGNSLEETLSLLMAANATVQNPAKASTAMRTITARIRNSKAELGDLGETLEEEYNTVAKYRDQLLGLSGIDIFGANGDFRSTYDILKDLADVWGLLDNRSQAAITTMLAGTRNQDIFSSLMKNFPEAIAAMDGMDDAAGMMDQKFIAVSQSISGALSELSNAFSKFSTNLVNSGGIVKAVQSLTGLVNGLDKVRSIFGTGGLAAFSAFIPMLTKLNSLNFGQLRGFASMLGSQSQWGEVITAMQTMTPLQRQVIMNFAAMDSTSQQLFIDQAKLNGVNLSAAGSFGTLAGSVNTAKMSLENFAASGSAYIIVIQLLILALSAISQHYTQAAEEAKRLSQERSQAALDAVKDTKNSISEYDELESSISGYITQLEQIQTALNENDEGSKAYADAQRDLLKVNTNIVNVFGEEADVIKGITGDLNEYATALEKIARRKRWDELNSAENAVGVNNALGVFGVDRNGNSIKGFNPFRADTNIAFSYKTTNNAEIDQETGTLWFRLGQTADEYVQAVLGDTLSQYIDIVESSVDTSAFNSKYGAFQKQGEGIVESTITALGFKDADSVIDIINALEARYRELMEVEDTAGATLVAQILTSLKAATGYADALTVFKDYMSGLLEFGGGNYPVYDQIMASQDAFNQAVQSRNKEEAVNAQNTVIRLLDQVIGTARQAGATWAVEFFDGLKSEFVAQSSAALGLLDSSLQSQIVTAHNPQEDYRKKMSGFNQGIAMDAIGNVGDLGEKMHQFLGAREIYNTKFTQDELGKIHFEGLEEDLKNLNEFFGTDFKEITEDNAETFYKAFSEMFDDVGEDLYGSVEGNVKEAIDFITANTEGFDISPYITDENVNFDGLMAKLNEIPVSADQAGASAALALAQELQTVAGMTFSLSADPDTGTVTVTASGGTGTYTPKKGGGGGGGKKKKSKYEQDLDALERIIKMLREQLNYYEEGSDQWIARQRQIIDRYKAGVAITMQEYNRLIKSGLKQTDDSVKEIVDQILEYQDDIYKESENLWEAVRQNQIDSLEHLKDQNDAAIKLEETHHDLLDTIRDERRELEDELRTAREAYSEVMTPDELNALFSEEDYADLMDHLATIEGEAMSMYADYKAQIAAVTEDETYMVDYITDEFERQYELKMKEYEIAKAELGVAKAQQELENVRNEQTVMMLKDGMWQWVADPEKVLEAERKLAEAERDLLDAQDEFDFQSLVNQMEANSSELQRQIDALKALKFSMDNLAEQIHLFSDKVYKDLLQYLSASTQQYFKQYEGSTAVPAFHSGGVVASGGLAEVHSGEPIFGTEDAVKLWHFVHNLDSDDIMTAQTMAGVSRMAVGNMGATMTGGANSMVDNSITINGMRVEGDDAQMLITVLRQVVASYQPNY